MTISVEIQISDTHIGHKTAIMYPDPQADFEHKINKPQRWLFKTWNIFTDDIERILDTWKPDHVHLSLLGDMGDVDYKDRSRQFWTKDQEVIRENFENLLRPIVAFANSMHTVRGTKAHVGDEGGVDERIASTYGELLDPVTGVKLSDGIAIKADGHKQYSHWFAEFVLAGVRFEIAHHGRNKTKWTTLNGLASLRAEIILGRTEDGDKIPDVVSRGHFHWSGHLPWDMKPYMIAVPSWQLPTDFIYRIDPVLRSPIVGGHVIVARDGKVVYGERLNYQYPRKRAWVQR